MCKKLTPQGLDKTTCLTPSPFKINIDSNYRRLNLRIIYYPHVLGIDKANYRNILHLNHNFRRKIMDLNKFGSKSYQMKINLLDK